MEILGEFGINPILLVAQIVNFLIIFYIVKRFALKPILALLKKRENTIKEGLQQAQESVERLEKAQEKERVLLKKAQTDAKGLLSDANKQAEEMIAVTEEKTRVQVEKILLEAREQITQETKEAEKRLSAQVTAAAVTIVQKSLAEFFSGKEQNEVVEKAIKELKKKTN